MCGANRPTDDDDDDEEEEEERRATSDEASRASDEAAAERDRERQHLDERGRDEEPHRVPVEMTWRIRLVS